jgi:hypothetical protein
MENNCSLVFLKNELDRIKSEMDSSIANGQRPNQADKTFFLALQSKHAKLSSFAAENALAYAEQIRGQVQKDAVMAEYFIKIE